MPFIGFELDAKKKVGPAARLAGVGEEKIGWGLIDLWSWCWAEKRAAVDLILLEAFFGGDPTRVARALEAFGFLAAREDGLWRVKGAGRYLRISEVRSEAGKAAVADRPRDERGRLMSRKEPSNAPANAGGASSNAPAADRHQSSPYTDHLTPNTDHLEDLPSEGDADAPPEPSPDAFELSEQRAGPKPRKLSEQELFAEWFEQERKDALGADWSEDKAVGSKVWNKKLGWLKDEKDDAPVKVAVGIYLADPRRRGQSPPCSLWWFAHDRVEYLDRARKQMRGAA